MNTGIINSVVERLFPDELVSADAFKDWCSRIREDVQSDAADLVALLKQKLASAIPECRKTCGPSRKCWKLFGGEGDAVIKSAASIRSKLARDLMSEQITAPRETEESMRQKIYAFSDLGRVRVVADFPSDILCLQQKLLAGGKFLDHYECLKGIKDFVFDPSRRDGLKGHRARQFSVRVPINGSAGHSFGFEVQLMTRLQHAWDRRNHPFYEWQRENPDWMNIPEAVELAVNDFACAETLHLVDRQADHNWQVLQKLLHEKGKT